jgi:hypothetical protein
MGRCSRRGGGLPVGTVYRQQKQRRFPDNHLGALPAAELLSNEATPPLHKALGLLSRGNSLQSPNTVVPMPATAPALYRWSRAALA